MRGRRLGREVDKHEQKGKGVGEEVKTNEGGKGVEPGEACWLGRD